jgi:hypothetical protein
MARYSILAGLAALALVGSLTWADDPAPTRQPPKPRTTAKERPPRVEARPSLGIRTAPVPEVLLTHRPDVFKSRHGLLIREVAAGSSAHKAGLEAGQVLLAVAGQRIVSPEHLARVLGAVKHKQVDATVLAAGKVVLVRLAVERVTVPPRPIASTVAFSSSTTLGNISIAGVAGHFKVEVAYHDRDGKLRRQRFTGTWDEVSGQLDRLPRKLAAVIRAQVEQ